MTERDNTDVWTAVAIGAVVGIGATLLLRAQQHDDTHEIIKRLRPLRRRAQQAAQYASRELGGRVMRGVRAAGDTGEDVMSVGRDLLEELQDGAREIVREARSELRKAAKQSLREARRRW
ncbi:MAG TPA: hypothetical protein VMN60_01350 [Longimicrobiales bacterium]|nr:hypothetical protein [Longimicrobiales bacterium]